MIWAFTVVRFQTKQCKIGHRSMSVLLPMERSCVLSARYLVLFDGEFADVMAYVCCDHGWGDVPSAFSTVRLRE